MSEELNNGFENQESEMEQSQGVINPVTETAIESEENSIIENQVVENKVITEEQPDEVSAQTEENNTTNKPRQSVVIPNSDDFDWNALDKHTPAYSAEQHKELENMYDQTLNVITEQEVVEGTIVSKSDREIVVNINFKSDGVLPASELRYLPDLKVGDKVEVFVECQEDASGQLLLSHKKARLLKSWARVNQAFLDGEIVNGCVKSKTKGGLIVDVFGIEAFLPGSQIDVKPIRDYDIFVDKTMEFKIVKINEEYKNVVVSHKALIESELEAQRMEIMAGLEKGQVLEGIVKNITNYGAFIDLGGVDGLIHITDISWGRIADPYEVLELDQKINVVILDFDEEKKRIALGIKQLTPHPWEALDANLTLGDKVTGKVVVIADYGAFIELIPGVEGLVHVSEMSWSQHLRTAHDFLKVGQTIDAVILTLDREERKMSLGIKQLMPDPWTNIIERYPVNSKHTAVVRNFTSFGIFVELEEGVDGLIHISDLSWSKKIKHPAEFTRIGEKIDVVVLEIDAESRRLSVGHKQLEDNPWDVYETIYNVGSIHQGVVGSAYERGMVVALQGVEGFAYNRSLYKEDGTTIRKGETADFKVIEFSKEARKIILSHAKIWQDARDAERESQVDGDKKMAKNAAKAAKRLSDSIEKSTLGDLDAFISLKADLENAEDKAKEQVKTAKKSSKATKKEASEKEVISPIEGEGTPAIEEISTVIEPSVVDKMSLIEETTAEEKMPAIEIIAEKSNVVEEEKPKKTRKSSKKAVTESEVENNTNNIITDEENKLS
jgi:small subunit ribosomal protein S1